MKQIKYYGNSVKVPQWTKYVVIQESGFMFCLLAFEQKPELTEEEHNGRMVQVWKADGRHMLVGGIKRSDVSVEKSLIEV
jgi:hypothetical protein